MIISVLAKRGAGGSLICFLQLRKPGDINKVKISSFAGLIKD